jgi:hypothetical protein
MQKIVSYVDLCSHALLSYLDCDVDGYYIEITKDFTKRSIRRYMVDHLKDDIVYGKTLIIVNSCNPKLNFRNDEELHRHKYELIDASISVDDFHALYKFFEDEWDKQNLNAIQLRHDNLDFIDMSNILDEKLPLSVVKPPMQYILVDGNNDFMHDEKINKTYLYDVELMLTEKKLFV